MSTKEIEERIDQIRLLEERLIALKRDLVLSDSSTPRSQSDEDKLVFVLLGISDMRIALPLQLTVEVVQMVELIPSSCAIAGVAGLLNYHGEVLAVIDVGVLLGMPKAVITPEKSMAICRLGSCEFALIADDVTEVVTVGPDDIKIEDEILPGVLKATGIVKANDQTSFIIDLWSVVISVQARLGEEEDIAFSKSIPASENDGDIEP